MKHKNETNCPVEVTDDSAGSDANESVSESATDLNESRDIVRSGVREFGSEQQQWVETALAFGTPYDLVVSLFLDRFPEYGTGACSPEELKRVLRQRIKHANTSKARVSYDRIREKESLIEELFEYFPVINVIPQVVRLQELFDTPDLRPSEVLKVIDSAQRLRDKILGDDVGSSSGKPKSVWEKDDSEILGDLKLGGKKNVGA